MGKNRPDKIKMAKTRLLKLSLFIIFAFLLGLVKFIWLINTLKIPEFLPKLDAIIALTGGKNRITEAYNLLESGAGKRLFISGVHQKSDKTALARERRIDNDLFLYHVDLGVNAENTLGNAIESKKWIEQHGYKRIYLVTSDYHMPRSLLEFQTLMPKILFIAFPVKPEKLNTNHLLSSETINFWWQRGRLFVLEYLKYIREKIRFMLFSPERFL